jgi:sporulation protein YlmC with PRC-barrel domain
MVESKVRAGEIVGKTIISEETGRKFGVVSNIDFITESGELLNLVVEQGTKHLTDLNLKVDNNGRPLIPFGAVKSIGDFVIVSENELI